MEAISIKSSSPSPSVKPPAIDRSPSSSNKHSVGIDDAIQLNDLPGNFQEIQLDEQGRRPLNLGGWEEKAALGVLFWYQCKYKRKPDRLMECTDSIPNASYGRMERLLDWSSCLPAPRALQHLVYHHVAHLCRELCGFRSSRVDERQTHS